MVQKGEENLRKCIECEVEGEALIWKNRKNVELEN